MKKIEDYICTLEQAKMLKELGINEEPLLGWWVRDFGSEGYYFAFDLICKCREFKYEEIYQAYTCQELIELLNENMLLKDAINLFPVDFGDPKKLAAVLIEILTKNRGIKNYA